MLNQNIMIVADQVYKVTSIIDEKTELMKDFLKWNTDLNSNAINDMFEY